MSKEWKLYRIIFINKCNLIKINKLKNLVNFITNFFNQYYLL
jgi:hypothetical protein